MSINLIVERQCNAVNYQKPTASPDPVFFAQPSNPLPQIH